MASSKTKKKSGNDSPPQPGIWESINLSFPSFFSFGNPSSNSQSLEQSSLTMPENYGTVEVSEKEKEWKWGAMIVAALGQMCCVVCGVPAVILAILSYIDNMRGEYTKYLRRRKVAIVLGIAAIISGAICLGLLALAAERVSREAEKAIITVDDLKTYVRDMQERV